ncbi:MAG: right-handed parallel beta-helix repeat-containing protein [Gemmatimonadetes bacterium]|nr:right-handed parallel beta-helix repeat-containing protein [Gemmatimonadota bacterium]
MRIPARTVPAFFLLLASPTAATTWNVLPDGTGDFATIQAAIDAATDGDVIELGDGTFTGAGNDALDFLGKAITVRSASGNPESCRLGLQDNMGLCEFPGVRFGQQEGPGSVLEAVTIQNHQDGAGDVGECIDFATVLLTDSSPTLRRVVFRDNAPVEGHGTVVRARGGAPRFEDCVFRGNWGKALELVDSNATVTGCILESNYGGGVSSGATLTVYGGSPLVTSTAIRRNGNLGIGGDVGAGVLVRAGTPTLDGCLIAENYLDGTGAGIVVEPGANLTVTRTTIAGNRAITGGGVLVRGSCTITQSVIGANCSTTDGPDVHVSASGQVSLDCTAVDISRVSGPGLVSWGATIVAADPLFCEPRTCEDPPSDEGLYSLQLLSPARDVPGCGTLGALYGVCTVSVAPMSWGRVKEMYRN